MRKKRSTDHFDLLPFIAILMCTLGTLLLVTLCMAAINLGPQAGEAWIPSADKDHGSKIPVLFQWDGAALVVEQDKRTLRYDIPLQAYQDSTDGSAEEKILAAKVKEGYALLKDWLAADFDKQADTHYALFAVRPSGFHTFGALRSLFRERGITIGYEPIQQDKRVHLARQKAGKSP